MGEVRQGMSAEITVQTDKTDTAAAVGNPGVEVISTAALIVMLEGAADQAIRACYRDGEATLGTLVNVRHVGAAPAGTTITARANVREVDGRRILFAVEAYGGEKCLMHGTHERVIVNLERFLASQGLTPRQGTPKTGS